MKKLLALTAVQAKLFIREPAAFFFTLVFPVLLIVMFGLVFGNEPGGMFPGPFGYIDYSTPAMTVLIIVSIGLMSLPIQTATARENRILRRFRATPLHPATYVGATVIVYFLMAFVGMVMTILVAEFFFGLRFGGNWWNVAAGFTFVSAAFFSAGYLIASVASTARVAQVVGQMLFFPMMFLSGAAIPLQIMPEGVRRVAELLPMTHGVKLMQNLWFGQGWSGSLTHVLVMLALLVAGLVLSTRLFRWE
ncbi:MAG: ABC transporter permease [Gemmatimonadota bacterium]|nr:ABC transporter permease [Gemmatimonadota bacterium]